MKKLKLVLSATAILAKGVELAVRQNPDFELVAIFTRRTPAPNSGLTSIDKILDYKGKIDVMVMCGGSATDLPVQVPEIAAISTPLTVLIPMRKIPETSQR